MFVDREGGGFDVQVDAIEEGAADAGAITLDLRGRTAAFVTGIAQVAARAGVHRRDEHETAGQRDFAGAARNGDMAVFKRIRIYSISRRLLWVRGAGL
jgi:hypothetical protein